MKDDQKVEAFFFLPFSDTFCEVSLHHCRLSWHLNSQLCHSISVDLRDKREDSNSVLLMNEFRWKEKMEKLKEFCLQGARITRNHQMKTCEN